MSRNWSQDVIGILRGAQAVVNATIKLQEVQCKQIWENSSVKNIVQEAGDSLSSGFRQTLSQDNIQNEVSKKIMETFQRTSMVFEGVKGYAKFARGYELAPKPLEFEELDVDAFQLIGESHQPSLSTSNLQASTYVKPPDNQSNEQFSEHKNVSDKKPDSKVQNSEMQSGNQGVFVAPSNVIHNKISDENLSKTTSDVKTKTSNLQSDISKGFVPPAKVKYRTKQTLSATAKERKVPASRIARLVSFGSLAAGLGIGTVAEVTRRSLGLTKEEPSVGRALDSAFLSEANAERIVNTLCKVRGAALKLGQILSIQDNTIISPTLQKAFERVRQSADFMPTWQVEKVLETELGENWRSKIKTFNYKPFAAASIGQVHSAVLPDGIEVAMKIQYPGVAEGIESDIDNLVGIMKVWNVFPESLFIDNLVQVAKRELSWEVDYEHEMEATKKFRELLKPYPDYYVPRVIDELTTKQIFTTELVEGIPVDKCIDMDKETKEHIGRLLMELCLKELFEFQYMQTDPNWSNFFYDPESKKLILLDFGASRPYSKKFLDTYIQIIRGAADDDRDAVLKGSRELGFLTGYESKVMEAAHVDAVMILGEVFRKSEPFDFGAQNTTKRIQHLVPTMLKHRLCPPPEEIYSLHRKLSGIFLLVAKLNVKIECKSMFDKVYEHYRSR